VYEILGQIYGELYDMFSFETFHFGGNEVNFNCWNSSRLVTDYMKRRREYAAMDKAGK
jgi:hexosaminidase